MRSTCISLILLSAALNTLTAQTKRALIIAIGNYLEKGGWHAISSNRDVNYVTSTLLQQNFNSKNIKTVVDGAATPKGLSDALTALIEEVESGDIVVIHVSSHGAQVQDDNNDETDGLDEAIATYNAVMPSLSKNYQKDQAEYFRDDRFGYYINKLRTKIGETGDVIVFLDLCHSGSGTRGLAKVRGSEVALVSPDFDRSKFIHIDTADGFRDANASQSNEKTLAAYVVISASKANELNYETRDHTGQGVGLLTYAASKAFASLEPGSTYRCLFAKIHSAMLGEILYQHPVLEGNGVDRMLFGGKFVSQKPYVEIKKTNGKWLTLMSGKLFGLDAGANIAVYNSGTIDPAQSTALAKGTVVKAESYTAEVELDGDPGLAQPSSGWVFVTKPVYGIHPVVLRIVPKGLGEGFGEAEILSIKSVLTDLSMVLVDGDPELLLRKGSGSDSLIIAANGQLFDTLRRDDANRRELKEAILRYVQYKFLRVLELKDPNAGVEVKLVPVVNGKADTTKISTKIINGKYTFSEGDRFAIWVKNEGNRSVYINILDIQPNGIIHPVLPLKSKSVYPGDLRIEKGSSRLFDNIELTVAPPCGTEIFKIFVSKNELDLESIATTRGEGRRGSFSPLESLLQLSYHAETRGKETNSIGNAEGSTYNLLFDIRPKQ